MTDLPWAMEHLIAERELHEAEDDQRRAAEMLANAKLRVGNARYKIGRLAATAAGIGLDDKVTGPRGEPWQVVGFWAIEGRDGFLTPLLRLHPLTRAGTLNRGRKVETFAVADCTKIPTPETTP